MKRFFAFGCSYTSYSYATWADLIGIHFKEYYNYGRAGCSNAYIMNRVVEANEMYQFNPETDYVGPDEITITVNDLMNFGHAFKLRGRCPTQSH